MECNLDDDAFVAIFYAQRIGKVVDEDLEVGIENTPSSLYCWSHSQISFPYSLHSTLLFGILNSPAGRTVVSFPHHCSVRD